MKFINNGEPKKIRLGNIQGYYWVTIRNGETIELEEARGLSLGLEKLKPFKSKIGNTVVETKIYTPDDEFYDSLIKIKGIGKKMASDIVEWGTQEKLIEHIQQNKKLPFRDDIELKLRENYGSN